VTQSSPAKSGFFPRLAAILRRASAAVYRGLLLVLLAIVYLVVLPWFALAWRLGGARPGGWRRRHDPGLASLERLRSLF
jgi:hypothetical protein